MVTINTIFTYLKIKRKDASLTEKWTRAIDRKNKDGSKWVPSKSVVICGKHFINGRPSDDSRYENRVYNIRTLGTPAKTLEK